MFVEKRAFKVGVKRALCIRNEVGMWAELNG